MILIAYFVIVTNLQNHFNLVWISFTLLMSLKLGTVIQQRLRYTRLFGIRWWRWSDINFNWHYFSIKTVELLYSETLPTTDRWKEGKGLSSLPLFDKYSSSIFCSIKSKISREMVT